MRSATQTQQSGGGGNAEFYGTAVEANVGDGRGGPQYGQQQGGAQGQYGQEYDPAGGADGERGIGSTLVGGAAGAALGSKMGLGKLAGAAVGAGLLNAYNSYRKKH